MNIPPEDIETLLSNSPGMLYQLAIEDGGRRPVFVSKSIERMLGITAVEATDYNWWLNSLHPEDRDRVLATVWGSVDSGGYTIQYRVLHKNGEYRWIEDTSRVVLNADGQPSTIVGVWTDIGERKRLQSELAQRDNRLAAFFSGATAGLALYDAELRYTQVSEALAQINRLPVADHIGRTTAEILPSLVDRVVPYLEQVLKTGTAIPYMEVCGVLPPDLSTRHWAVSYFPILDNSGHSSGVGAIIVEVTAQKRAEEEVKESRARLELALQASSIGQWDWNMETNEVHFSREWKSQLGYEEHEIADEFSEWASRVHPEDLESVMAALNRFQADTLAGYEVEFRLRHKNGTYRWIHTRARTGHQSDSRRTFGCHVDITDRKNAEMTLQQENDDLEARVRQRTAELENANEEMLAAKRQAEEANVAKSAFLSRMSHELRTPMNAILGFGQLLEMSDLDEKQAFSLGHIIKGGRHLLNLINEVLDIARVEAGFAGLSNEPVELNSLVEECMSLMEPLADRSSVTLSLEEQPGLCVSADLQKLRQVVLNLLTNAVNYNAAGGWVKVRIRAISNELACLEVEDNGWGIASELLPRLFTPFDRLGAEATVTEGTGLGLSLSKALLEAMGGQITVQSIQGEGSVFTVTLKRAVSLAEPVEVTPIQTSENSGDHPVRILAIEDNLMNLELLSYLFANRPGVELVTAMQGRIGLQLAHDQKPDVILLDLHLPDMHGSEVLAAIRQGQSTKDIPVIIVSADAFPSQIAKLTGMGAFRYVTKPYILSEIVQIVEEAAQVARGNRVVPAGSPEPLTYRTLIAIDPRSECG